VCFGSFSTVRQYLALWFILTLPGTSSQIKITGEKKHSYSESERMKFHKPVSATWRKNGPEFENVKETATTKWSVRVRLEEKFSG